MKLWKRLPRTWADLHAMALGKPDPNAGLGVPQPRAEPDRCLNCRFWHYGTDEHFRDVNGRCRRYAPRGFTRDGGGSLFPPMNSNQWCGEYQPLEGGSR